MDFKLNYVSPTNCAIFYGPHKLRGIKAITIHIDAEHEAPTVQLTLLPSALEIHAGPINLELIKEATAIESPGGYVRYACPYCREAIAFVSFHGSERLALSDIYLPSRIPIAVNYDTLNDNDITAIMEGEFAQFDEDRHILHALICKKHPPFPNKPEVTKNEQS